MLAKEIIVTIFLVAEFQSVCVCLQPVGFVTFNTRAGAEAAKQDLQVRNILNKFTYKYFVHNVRTLTYFTFVYNACNTSD